MEELIKLQNIKVGVEAVDWQDETFELEQETKEDENILFYGQKDHVRLYGNDVQKRLEQAGYKVNVFSTKMYSEQQLRKYGYEKNDTVFICERNR